MFYHVVVFALIFGTTSSQLFGQARECGCRVPSNFQTSCVSNPYATNRQQCQAAGCCWENDILSVLRGNCYAKNSRYCRQGQDVCQPAIPLQACLNLGPFFCETQGCCYDASRPPYCFRKRQTNFFTAVTTPATVTQWSVWSLCSKPCSPGSMTRTRQCLSGTPQLCVNQGYSLLERMSCNNDLCTAWGQWTTGPCSVTCGIGVASTFRSCIGPGSFGRSACFSSSERCARNSCPTTQFITFTTPTFRPPPTPAPVVIASWEQWGTWSTCDKKCSPGIKSRTRRCILRGRTVNSRRCVNSFGTKAKETTICNENMCKSWTTWSPYSSCSLTCGEGSFRYLSRSCKEKIPSDLVPRDFSSCIRRRLACNLSPCPTVRVSHLMRSSTFRTTTPPSVQTTTKQTIVPTTGRFRPKPNTGTIFKFTSPTSVAKTTIPSTTTTTTPTATSTTTSTTTSSTTSTTTPATTPTTTSTTTTTTTTTEAPTTVFKMVASWQNWLEWSECSSSCSPGTRVRARICAYSSGDQVIDDRECGGEGPIQSVPCNENFCDNWSQWSVASCTVTCKSKDNEIPGFQAQTRHCLVDEIEEAREECYIVATLCNATTPCEEPTTYSPPTQTMAPSALPETTTLPPATAAPTTTTTTTTTTASTTMTTTTTTASTTTTTKSKAPRSSVWAEWGDWSDCSSPCSPGIQSRARRCLPGVAPQFCVEGAVDSRGCNSGFCTSWSGWRTEECDKTCGKDGKQKRRRICLSGQITNDTPENCYQTMEPCGGNLPACKEASTPSPKRVLADPKLDVLFLVDSSNYVDNCDIIEDVTNLKRPIRGEWINATIAPTYTRIKKFMTDFVNSWGGISDDGTRISIQLFSNLCSPRTKSNLHVEKKFNESHEELTRYIKELPYLCGDYWLDWALQCAINPVLTTSFGDRKDVPNVVVAILSNAPATSQPSDTLLRLILRRLTSGATVMSATATELSKLSPKSKARYEKNTRKVACSTDEKCSAYLGSIWNAENDEVAELVRAALRDAGQV